jgi:NAD(P)-dependent dehydrogenase (short-subunit alcohol dehydrogenase family)
MESRVAVVLEANGAIGRAIPLELGKAGAKVYVTGKSISKETIAFSPPIQELADEIRGIKGTRIPYFCNTYSNLDLEALFHYIDKCEGRLDLLVNNFREDYPKTIGAERDLGQSFWLQPIWCWNTTFQLHIRPYYIANRFAAPIMVRHRKGLIVNIHHENQRQHIGKTLLEVSRATIDQLTVSKAHELIEFDVAVISIYLGQQRTQGIISGSEPVDRDDSESFQSVACLVAQLAADQGNIRRTGKVFSLIELAREWGVQIRQD